MKNERFDAARPMQVGGQAVIEGVMMRAPGMVATAVRRANGAILVKKEPFRSLAEQNRIFKFPVLRGAVGLVEMMFIGIRSLNFSAEAALEDSKSGANGSTPASPKQKTNLALGITVAASLLLSVAVFFVTPLFLATILFSVDQNPLWFNLVSGAMRIGLLLGYLGLISLLKDISRLFEYHGAEHKAVFAFEFGEMLDIPSAAKQTRFHPRCGTSFLLIVMFVAIILFSIFDTFLMSWLGSITLPVRLLTHLPLIPLVGGVSYECIRLSSLMSTTAIGKAIAAPGLWLQRITTREPDAGQIEVALVALRHALGQETEASIAANEQVLEVAAN